MRTIALIGQKGGTGKTTLALHIATAFHGAGKGVWLLDLDPQASATQWADARSEELPHVESIQAARLAKRAEQARSIGTDILILDTAPHSESTALDAARLADLVLVPCQPSIMDLRAIGKTIDLLKLVKVPAFAVMNGVPHHAGAAADDAASTIEETLGLPVAPVRIGERVAYSRSLITGHTAQEIEPEGKAAAEIDQLRVWIAKQLRQKVAA